MPSDLPPTGYYVYTLGLAEDSSQVFYVGKGKNGRIRNHIPEAMSGVLSPKCAIIRYLLKTQQDIWYHIIAKTSDEHQALWYEMKVITSFPYGALCNLFGGQRPPIRVWREKTGIWEGEVQKIGSDGTIEVVFSAGADSEADLEKQLRPIYDKWIVEHYYDTIVENPSLEEILTT